MSVSKPNSTSLSGNKASCTWVVDDIANVTKCINSSAFYFPNSEKTAFYLISRLKQNLFGLYDDGYDRSVAVFLRIMSSDTLPVRCRLSILDAQKRKRNEQVCQLTLEKDFSGFGHIHGVFNLRRDYLLDRDNGLLVNGNVTFYCEVEILEDKAVVPVYNETLLLQTSQNYAALLESGKLTDVILKIGDQELNAHKSILSAQSQVFAAMFEHECKENRENVVEITDVSVDVFKELLRFLYSGMTPNLKQFAPELLAAADKYQLVGLKSLCAQFLALHLDVELVAGILLLADLHDEADLKTKCIEFITERAHEVIDTDGWKRLVATNRADLIAVLFHSFSVKQKKHRAR